MSAHRFVVTLLLSLLFPSGPAPVTIPFAQAVKLVPSVGETATFGTVVAMSGNTLVVGGAGDPEGLAVYVFTRSDGAWSEQAVLRPSDSAAGFGQVLAVSGDTVVVGASSKRVGTVRGQGAAYVFARSGGVWSEQAVLLAADGAADDGFGTSVAISGDTIVVGAARDDVGVNANQGSAYVFTRADGVWIQEAQFSAGNGEAADRFGATIAMSGVLVVVGATSDDVEGRTDQGSAYVFARGAGGWSQQAQLTAGDGAAGDAFASGLAISGDTVVAGAPAHSVGANLNQGAGYVFTRNAGAWSQQAMLTASDGAAFDSFGNGVAISGETIVAGAYGRDIDGKELQGSAYVFKRSGSAWNQGAELIASDGAAGDVFGKSVAVDALTVFVGASATASPLQPSGSAYVFSEVPVAQAGADQLLIGCAGCYVPVVLDGSASTDASGTALQYSWREGGVVLATTTSPYSQASVALGFGTHTIELTVTNAGGGSATDTVVVNIVAASSLSGPAGPQGATGLQGPKGDKGDRGEGLSSGSMLFVAAGSPAPTGYTFVGRFDLQLAETNRGRGTQVQFDVYRKN